MMAIFREGNLYGKLTCSKTLACISYDGRDWDSSYDTWLSGVSTQFTSRKA